MIDVSPVESSPCEDDTTVDMPLPGTQEDAPSCDGDEVDTALCDYVASLPGTQEGACSRDGDNNDTQHHTTGGVYQETNESMLSTKAEEPSEAISTHLYTLSEEYVDHTMYQMNGSYISENNHIVTSWIHMWCNKVIKHGKETLEKYPDRLKNCYPPTPYGNNRRSSSSQRRHPFNYCNQEFKLSHCFNVQAFDSVLSPFDPLYPRCKTYFPIMQIPW